MFNCTAARGSRTASSTKVRRRLKSWRRGHKVGHKPRRQSLASFMVWNSHTPPYTHTHRGEAENMAADVLQLEGRDALCREIPQRRQLAAGGHLLCCSALQLILLSSSLLFALEQKRHFWRYRRKFTEDPETVRHGAFTRHPLLSQLAFWQDTYSNF